VASLTEVTRQQSPDDKVRINYTLGGHESMHVGAD